MAKQKRIILPKSVREEMGFSNIEEAYVDIDGERFKLQANREDDTSQKFALRWVFIPSIIATVLFSAYFYWRDLFTIPLSGQESIASVSMILALISGMISFITGFIIGKRRKDKNLTSIYWRNLPTILISLIIILALVLLIFYWVMGRIFEGLELDIYTASGFAFILFAIVNYFMFNFVMVLTPSMMTKLLIVFIMGGALMAMITNSEKQWWQNNISFLGTAEATRSWQFNLTLILSALLMVALIDNLFVLIRKAYPDYKPLTILRILLTITAICLGLVGLFPADGAGRMPEYHEQAAGMLVYMIIIMIVGIKWFLPRITREFLLISWGIGITLVVITVLAVSGIYFTLTGFELIGFFLAFSWLMLLLQNLNELTKPMLPTYIIHWDETL